MGHKNLVALIGGLLGQMAHSPSLQKVEIIIFVTLLGGLRGKVS